MNTTGPDRPEPVDDEIDEDSAPGTDRREPGGPYFGRLLIVLLLAVAFCGVMTWYLSSVMTD